MVEKPSISKAVNQTLDTIMTNNINPLETISDIESIPDNIDQFDDYLKKEI
ncbi:28730_t:CDS:1, partial [Racocetra persica]